MGSDRVGVVGKWGSWRGGASFGTWECGGWQARAREWSSLEEGETLNLSMPASLTNLLFVAGTNLAEDLEARVSGQRLHHVNNVANQLGVEVSGHVVRLIVR